MLDGMTTILGVDDFLEKIIPAAGVNCTRDSSNDEAVFARLPLKFTSEQDMYALITTALANARICSEYTFVATSCQSDVVNSGGMYPIRSAPDQKKRNQTLSTAPDWSEIELALRCKPDVSDPFNDTSGDVPHIELLSDIMSDVQLIHEHQHRIFQLMVLFIGDVTRLITIDHSSVFVSESVLYRSNPAPILELFWRVDQLRDTPARRGHDPTAERIPHASSLAQKMQRAATWQKGAGYDYPQKLFEKSLNRSWPWCRLTIPCTLADGSVVERKFLVGRPHSAPCDRLGRGTRGYVAIEDNKYEEEEHPQFVYLKDSWRTLHPEIYEEGKTLSTLNNKGVRFVPTVLCYGDIAGQLATHSRNDLWEEPQSEQARLRSRSRLLIKAHSHYRLVVREVGRPLEDFDDGAHLVWVMYCVLQAHFQAYEVGMIHRNINVGNILIYPDASGYQFGLLNGWELSKRRADDEAEGRQLDRMGTWQSLSVRALNDPTKKTTLQDELESIFHVLLCMAIRFLPHNCRDDRVESFLYKYFDDYDRMQNEDIRCGKMKQASVNAGKIDLSSVDEDVQDQTCLIFLLPGSSPSVPTAHPINSLIDTVLTWFKAYARALAAASRPAVKQPSVTLSTLELIKLRELEKRGLRPRAGGEDPPSAANASRTDASVDQQSDLALASKIGSHKEMLDLFLLTTTDTRCPRGDKGADKKKGAMWGIAKADHKLAGSQGVDCSGNPSGHAFGSEKRPRTSEDDHLDVEDRPATSKRRCAHLPRPDIDRGPCRLDTDASLRARSSPPR